MVKTNFSMAMALALCMVLCAGFSEIHPLYYGVWVKQSLCVAFVHQRDKFKNKVTGCLLE